MPQGCHFLLAWPRARRRRGSPQRGRAAVAGAIGGGVNATVSRGALQIVVAVEFGFCAVPIVPLLVTVGTRCVAGEGIAAGVARVVAIRLQGKQVVLSTGSAP